MSRSYILTDITAATMAPFAGDYGLVREAAIAVSDGQIAWVGPASELPPDYADLDLRSFDGRLVTPALIDCHTHIVHGGNRAAREARGVAGGARGGGAKE